MPTGPMFVILIAGIFCILLVRIASFEMVTPSNAGTRRCSQEPNRGGLRLRSRSWLTSVACYWHCL